MAKKKSTKKADYPQGQVTGRPSLYRPEYCQMLIAHMSEGLSFETFAATIKTHRDTLYEWEKTHQDFSDAKKAAIEACQLYWEKLGKDHIINKSDSESSFGMGGSSKSRSLNAAIWVFNMKNRFKWRDKQPDESEVVVNNYNNLSDTDIDARIKELEKKVGK